MESDTKYKRTRSAEVHSKRGASSVACLRTQLSQLDWVFRKKEALLHPTLC
jgi:hypothetical protein